MRPDATNGLDAVCAELVNKELCAEDRTDRKFRSRLAVRLYYIYVYIHSAGRSSKPVLLILVSEVLVVSSCSLGLLQYMYVYICVCVYIYREGGCRGRGVERVGCSCCCRRSENSRRVVFYRYKKNLEELIALSDLMEVAARISEL